ncbi:cytoplasmic protein [Methylobacterium sp. Leaf399]|uniref:PH domain-containing protein n=1 Tax=unclassified Methylobacterium TaxID=2615210 RepID=UPI000702342B|nr:MULTISPECIES: PH domain-containing protein [unclassified Methylobacterium]KQP61260.1 cytoplasmic protein [Methylobacterium sp. Leaf108]KQT19412.1 cytoplasmic protein [Methylobacterium sp. Leaf399]KQT78189.1 cytoplasmic protein [Methylobacterium sp. Leaf466]
MGLLDGLLGHGSDLTAGEIDRQLDGVLTDGETVSIAFKLIRDLIVFTDRRLILVDKQGITGRKVSFLTVPYRAITSFSVETAGSFDMDSELKVWVSGRVDPIQKTLKRGANVMAIQKAIASSIR